MELTNGNVPRPLAFGEVQKLSKRPWGGALKGYRCFCCGSGMDLANHHIAPRAEGGSDNHRNKVTLCGKCHDAVEGAPWSEIVARREVIRRERRPDTPPEENGTVRCPTYVSAEDKERFNSERQLRELNSARTLEEYFSIPHAPAANSPVGRLMSAVLDKFPGMTFEQARARAHALLDCAAGKRAYRVPPVLTEEEQQTQRQAVRARFRSKGSPRHLVECPENAISSVGGPKKTPRKGLGTWASASIDSRKPENGLIADTQTEGVQH